MQKSFCTRRDAEERILDALLPPARSSTTASWDSTAEPNKEESSTRQIFRKNYAKAI